MDLSNITFNENHKLESSARDAATGIKLLALAFAASAMAIALALLAARTQAPGPGLSLAALALSFIAFAAGGYGAYLAASALDWSGFITVVIVLGAIVPYLKFVCFLVLVVFSIDLIRRANYTFSFFGPLRRRAVA